MNSLTTEDFAVRQDSLLLKRQGATLVLFYSKIDENSKKYYPIFKSLASSFTGVQYATIDVRDNNSVVLWSRKCNTPITSVPSLIFYVNGIPRAKIPPKQNIEETMKMISATLKSISMRKEPQRQQPTSSWMPDMTQHKQPRYQPEQPSSRFEDPDDSLLTPESITPYNTPWNVGRE